MQKTLASQAEKLLSNIVRTPRIEPVTFIVEGEAISGYLIATIITIEGEVTYYIDPEGNLYMQQCILTDGAMMRHPIACRSWDNLTHDETSVLRRSFNWFLAQFPSTP